MRNNYLKVVEWSEEDQCFIGDCPSFAGKCCHGDDEVEVYRELCEIVDEWIELYREEGRPLPQSDAGKTYSGKFNIRMTPEEHKTIAIKALCSKKSLNTFCVEAVTAF